MSFLPPRTKGTHVRESDPGFHLQFSNYAPLVAAIDSDLGNLEPLDVALTYPVCVAAH